MTGTSQGEKRVADGPSGYVLADNLNPIAKVPDQFVFDPREWEEFLEG